ncbi:MAG: NADPH-dependent assimilatory sulfite reductase hemoprotein subunit [Rickettsiales bacterium]|nr:NADPH-dependent assimilatory sulfite reductase hemoprotein subunit [Pseudomonadota bacterium]MDA0965605.1 NADPH-dependent assimilatory sulfite reductase hemoprotein subunit [Pseudomonadota bacterium]MDG4542929.1 NADPH-dependent assimilatory sulfite reductase hemoprotein subunit [Rickettsiales bacterium]MDG4544623.1 NADPH-dependent assimilatory sulfite reductase hemoprotein subunit [Rickettsiales bacterium]MDG4546745.1 NADPH-dependent assimilatory sulfite reductase hemoprotein subunit [Ricket
MSDDVKLSKVEAIKTDSIYLHGGLDKEMSSEGGAVSDEAYELLKFHGSYFGFDRDTATERKKAGLEKEWEFMVRMKAPGGRITAKQYLGLDSICEKYANGTLRITTRETFQFHCIIKQNMKKHIAAINELLLTTLGGCGDVVRNVMTSPAPKKDKLHLKLLEDANVISEFTLPKTSAYHEIWLDGENMARNPSNEDYEPLYGKVYLPRKFKISVSVPEDNSMDALTHDLAIIQIWEGGELLGYNLLLGGGLGMTHNKPETYPRLATPIAFIEPDRLLDGVAAVVKLHRDYGDRSNRKHARLKYVVEENGIEWTRSKLEEIYGEKMQDARPMGQFRVVDHMGWHEQGDGKWYLGVPVSSGRIIDRGEEKIRTGLREVVAKYGMDLVLTADQNVILCDIAQTDKQEIIDDLKSHGIKLVEDITSVYRNMLACVALPTCGKALADAERIKLPVLEEVEQVMEKHGILDEEIAIRIAGCPNGCSRPYVGDIGIVGRMPGHYAMFIGGDFEGTRLNTKILDRVPQENIKDVLDILFAKYKAEKEEGEGFGDYADRAGIAGLAQLVESNLGDKYKWAKAA